MALVRVPEQMKQFKQWVHDVTQSAQLRFGTRAKVNSSKKKFHVKRRRRRKRGKKKTE